MPGRPRGPPQKKDVLKWKTSIFGWEFWKKNDFLRQHLKQPWRRLTNQKTLSDYRQLNFFSSGLASTSLRACHASRETTTSQLKQFLGYKQETPLDLFSFSCFLQVSISVEQASPSPSYKRTDYGNSSIWWTHPSHPILKPAEMSNPLFSKTSGAMYSGVPHKVYVRCLGLATCNWSLILKAVAAFLPPVEGGKKRWINSHNVVISDGLNSKDKNQEGLWINQRRHLNRRPWLRLDLWATPTLWLWQSQSRWASRSLRYMVVNRFRFAWRVRHWFKGCNMLSMNHICSSPGIFMWYFHEGFFSYPGFVVLGTSSQDLHLPGHHLHWSRCSQVSGHGTQCSVHDSTWRKKTPSKSDLMK